MRGVGGDTVRSNLGGVTELRAGPSGSAYVPIRAGSRASRAPRRVSVTVGELLISGSASSGGREALSVSRLGTIGIAGAAYFVVSVVVLHFIQTDLDLIEILISKYGLGRFGWLLILAFLVVGVGTLALALGLRRSLAPGKGVATSVVLMALAGFGLLNYGGLHHIVSGLLEADHEAEATIHDLSGRLLFFTIIIGAFILRRVFTRDTRWHGLAAAALWFALGLLVTFLLFFLLPEEVTGVAQRVFVAVIMSWLAVIGWWMRGLGNAEIVERV